MCSHSVVCFHPWCAAVCISVHNNFHVSSLLIIGHYIGLPLDNNREAIIMCRAFMIHNGYNATQNLLRVNNTATCRNNDEAMWWAKYKQWMVEKYTIILHTLWCPQNGYMYNTVEVASCMTNAPEWASISTQNHSNSCETSAYVKVLM